MANGNNPTGTVQVPQRNPVVEALFRALDVIPQPLQQGLMKDYTGSPVDLGRINVSRPPISAPTPLNSLFSQGNLPPIPQTVPVNQSQVPSPSTPETTPPKIDPKRQERIQALINIGFPLAAAIAGTANPNLLPQAAGFATGFSTAVSDQDKKRINNLDRLEELEDFEKKERIKAKVESEQPEKLTAEEKKRKKNLESATILIKTLKERLNEIPSYSGSRARVEGLILKAKGAAGLDEKVSTYDNLRVSVLGQLAKIVSGESGRLTDQDIERIEKSVPRITDTKEERNLAFSLLEGLIEEYQLGSSNNGQISETSGSSKGVTSSGIEYELIEE